MKKIRYILALIAFSVFTANASLADTSGKPENHYRHGYGPAVVRGAAKTTASINGSAIPRSKR
jgi:hypothetical protein